MTGFPGRPRILFFFPHNPVPPRSGSHRRCLEMLAGFRELGASVVVASAVHTSETEWDPASIDKLRREFADEVEVYEAGWLDRLVLRVIGRLHRILRRELAVDSTYYAPPWMRLWFRRLTRRCAPDVVVVNYASWDGLTQRGRRRDAKYVIETHDLIAIQRAMRQQLRCHLAPGMALDAIRTNSTILDEDFFASIATPDLRDEYRIFDGYDYTIAISDAERRMIARNTRHTKVIWIPMTYTVPADSSSCIGPALFSTGPNPFNLQGYVYFVRKVLPLVRRTLPAFELTVTGTVCGQVAPESGVVLAGFVPDLNSLLSEARLVVCPILGMTGQQVKIVEAMAHGVPVVALRTAAAGSPIQHGVNGYIAADAAEFAAYVTELWTNLELCRRIGGAARDTIAAEYSRSRLVGALAEICRGSIGH